MENDWVFAFVIWLFKTDWYLKQFRFRFEKAVAYKTIKKIECMIAFFKTSFSFLSFSLSSRISFISPDDWGKRVSSFLKYLTLRFWVICSFTLSLWSIFFFWIVSLLNSVFLRNMLTKKKVVRATWIGWVRNTELRTEVKNDVSHFSTFSFPKVIPWAQMKNKQMPAITNERQ